MLNTVAVIVAGGWGTHLSVLSQKRVKPAVPFAGKYRIIDFALSNCANSGISRIGILTQHWPHLLNRHVGTGRPWDLDRMFTGGITLLQPYQTKSGSQSWYRGTADAVYQNLDFIQEQKADAVLMLSGDHIYKMDYHPLIRYHQEHQADVTICAIDASLINRYPFAPLVTDDGGRVVEFQEKSPCPHNTLASMDIYVFQADFLVQRLTQDAKSPDSSHDFEKDILPDMLKQGDRLYAYPFSDYWVDVDTVQAYWEANMDLLLPDPPLNLSGPQWSIHTRNEQRTPVNICRGATVCNSLISDGCVIEGLIEHSVLSPGVRVGIGAAVRDSILFSDCRIGAGAVVDRAILDKNVIVGRRARIGLDEVYPFDGNYPNGRNAGISLIGKNTHLPADLRVGRSCVIYSDLTEDDFVTGSVASGQDVGFEPPDPTYDPWLVADGWRDEARRAGRRRPRWNIVEDSSIRMGHTARKGFYLWEHAFV